MLISINTAWNIYNFRAPLVRALQGQGYRVVSAAPADAYVPRLAALVDQHIDLPMDNAGTSPWKDAMLFFRYVRVLRAVRPSVMLTYTIKPNIYGTMAAAWLGIPVINNVSGLGTAFIHRSWVTGMVQWLYRRAFRFSARVFFQNAEDRAFFIERALVHADKTALLAGSGVDLAYFDAAQEPARDSAAPPAFVLVARMLWDKGVGEFVEAARRVKAAHPQVRFRLVGPGEINNKTAIPASVIAAWVAEGVVEYWGETDAVRAVLAQHDCVVLPSYREGLSRVLLEAAAMGKPLIASDVPGCRQVVDHGRNGLLCAASDAASLAAAMEEFLRLNHAQRAAMGAESRAKAEREFDQQRVIEAYITAMAACA